MIGEEYKKINIVCPKCKQNYNLQLNAELFDDKSNKGIVTVALKPPCGHISQVFIDQKGKHRGGQAADLFLDPSKIEISEGDPERVAQLEKSKMLVKLTSEIILKNATHKDLITMIAAEEKIDKVEVALINGNMNKAKEILGDLSEFCLNIGDEMEAIEFSDQVIQIDQFMNVDEDFDWSTIVLNTENPSFRESELNFEIQSERIDAILEDLKFAVMKGELFEELFEFKKERLLVLKRELKNSI
ncbi:MAG: hypothetical protein ACFFCS_11145 [Candidatus Hodarchaeota archaeon]